MSLTRACQVPPETHLLGEDLATVVLKSTLNSEDSKAFFIVAYNPQYRGEEGKRPENAAKLRHVRLIAKHYGVSTQQVILFDDVKENVEHTQGLFRAFWVDPKRAFTFEQAIPQLQALLAKTSV